MLEKKQVKNLFITMVATMVMMVSLGCSPNYEDGNVQIETTPFSHDGDTLPDQLTPMPEIYLGRTTMRPHLIEDIGVSIQLEIRNDCVISLNEYGKVGLVIVPPHTFLHNDNGEPTLMNEDGDILYKFGKEYMVGTEGITDHLEEPVPERCEFDHLLPIY